MYIQEIILDGFKSYATRTVISGWDPSFNAITGLNGSGKSNILDAICFVLGIDNLKQVRAANLQDLIYKRGQSGITKASVSIVFNNQEKDKSPPGFSDQETITVTRQIVVGGGNKNKYLINGHIAQPRVIETMFQSVQLNVNNPHFLIMQGQITKVLNMKPPEILALIEETAGTRMFEDRRQKAQVTLDKKDRKVQEIQGLLQDVIEPKLSALRSERSEFVEFKRVEGELESTQRWLTASEYWTDMTRMDTLVKQQQEKQALFGESQSLLGQTQIDLSNLDQETETIRLKRTRELKNAKHFKDLEQRATEMTNRTVLLETQLNLKRQTYDEALARLKSLTSSDTESLIRQAQATVRKEEKEYQTLLDNYNVLTETLKQNSELLASLTTGVSTSNEGSIGYAKLLNDLKSKASELQNKLQCKQLEMSEAVAEMSQLEPKTETARQECAARLSAITELKAKITSLEGQLSTQDSYSSTNSLSQLQHEKRSLELKHRKLKDQLDSYAGLVAQLGLDLQGVGVKGVVAQLVDCQNPEHRDAIEVTAGGKLYNIVVSDERVANELFESGKLTKRVTLIPLNKIIPRSISTEKQKIAKQVDPSSQVALSLIGYPEDLTPAMQFIFGGTFISEDKRLANQLAFDKRISTRTVTLEGDVYEPSGTMTGGSAPKTGAGLLAKLAAYKQLYSELDQVIHKLTLISSELATMTQKKQNLDRLAVELDITKHQLNIAQSQLEASNAGQLLTRLDLLKKLVAELESELAALSQRKQALDFQIAQTEKDSADMHDNREGRLKALQRLVKQHTDQMSKDQTKLDKAQKTLQTAQVKLAHLQETRAQYVVEAETLAASLEALARDIESDDVQLAQVSAMAQQATEQFETELGFLHQIDSQLQGLDERKIGLTDQLERLNLQIRQLADELQNIQLEGDRLTLRLKETIKSSPWLVSDSTITLGHGQWNFTTQSISEARRRLRSLQDAHRRLKTSINVHVMEMLDRVEAKESSLKTMIATVRRDKQKIESTIDTLQGYKVEALTRTWHQVNEDFGSIFGELLPGSHNTCKLDPPEGFNALTEQGLEIKVCLGGVWKSGLAELSGGQRSVVALSLILAMLQFKPAPMYILDEVDAALDLSHTQNIGHLFKTRFASSQFIVVSLKEGMFSNANVLFKTSFKDGVSHVERIVHSIHENEDNSKKDGRKHQELNSRQIKSRQIVAVH